jgi:type IX secretion system PorP/SprF family membrane protein
VLQKREEAMLLFSDNVTVPFMKKLLLFITAIVMCNTAFTQSNIRLNNFWENFYYITPASINKQYFAVFSISTRKQWVEFDGAPTTFFASGTIYLDKLSTQFGMKIVEDKIGYTTTSNISISYAYVAMLNEYWRIHLGLAADFQTRDCDISKIIMDTPDDPTVYSNLAHKKNFNSDLGVELANKTYKIGAASQNIASLFDKKDNHQQVNTNFLYATYRDNEANAINLSAGLCGIKYDNLYQMEINMTAYFKSEQQTDLFHIGVLYRTPIEMGAIFGLNLGPSVYLSYSYNYTFSALNRSAAGSHELMLIYKIRRDPECHCY